MTDPETGSWVNALENVSLKVAKKEAVVVVGPSGSGKTTLLSVAAGLVRVSAGRVKIAGREVSMGGRAWDRWLRSKVGVAFQFPERSFFATTVREEIGLTATMIGWEPGRIQEAVERALESVGLHHGFLDRSPFRLSGGEKRRVALAAAVAHEPDLLLLDEPDVGMDLKGQRRVADLIRRLKDEGKALVVATHDVDAALGWADRCVVLEAGRVVDIVDLADGRAGAGVERLAPYLWDQGLLLRIHRAARSSGRALPDPYRQREAFLAAFTADERDDCGAGETVDGTSRTEGRR